MIELNFPEESADPKRQEIGWLCTYTPEEIIFAAGFHPFRIAEDIPATKMADTFLHHNLCPYVRSCLEFGLRPERERMEGVVIVNSCDAMHCLYHVWRKHVSSSFIHFMNVPRVTHSHAVEYFKQEIQKLLTVLEEYSGRRIEESDIAKAVDLYNESRDLMRELYELRKHPRFLLNGALVSKVIRANQVMPKKIFNENLKALLEKIKQQEWEELPKKKTSIMITGSHPGNSQIHKIIEEAGALVVCDDLCFGSRYFEGKVQKGEDLLMEISRRYLLKAPCARMKDTDARVELGERLVKEYSVDGIIYITLKFCDSHLYDYPRYRKSFQEMGIPVLQIEEDLKGGNVGQIRTRIEAFIEML